MDAIGFASHDHRVCIKDCARAAETYCRKAGLRFTQQRRRVLEILLAEHRALGAYDILDILRADGQTAQPPVAYRVLDFLVEHGFAHKVERLNAFIACTHPGEAHAPALLICRLCRKVAETPSEPLRDHLRNTATAAGFDIEATVVEALGICPNCSEAKE